MSTLDDAIGTAAANTLRDLYRDRRAQSRLDGCWNEAAHEEALAVVVWFAEALQSGEWEFVEVAPVSVDKPKVVVESYGNEQMRMM